MRTGIRTSVFSSASVTPVAARAKIMSVTAPWFRDFWFTATSGNGSGASYGLSMYDTKADAVAGTNRIAHSAAFSAGLAQAVLLSTLDAAWLTGPITVYGDFLGTWNGSVVLGYVGNVGTELVDQIVTVLTRYTAAHESLALLGINATNIMRGLQEPIGVGICVVARGQTIHELAGGPFDSIEFDVDLVSFDAADSIEQAQTRITSLAGTLSSIIEEQRFWGWGDPNGQGGPVVGTTLRGSIESGPVQDPGGAFYHRCTIPLRIELQLFTESVAPSGTPGAGGGAGGGGKYGDPSLP